MDMKMYQMLLMVPDKRNILLADCLGMSDIPGQTKLWTFKQTVDGLFLIVPETIRVLNGNHHIAVTDPFLAFGAKISNGLYISVEITVIHLYLPIRQSDVYAVVHMHIKSKRLAAVSILIAQEQQLFCHRNRPANCFQICI